MEIAAGLGNLWSFILCRLFHLFTFQSSDNEEPVNVMNVGLRWPPEGQEDPGEEATVRMLEAFCQEHCDRLKSVAVRRITFMLITPVG